MLNRAAFVTFYVGLCLGALLLPGSVFAQQNANESSNSLITTPPAPKTEKPWSLNTTVARTSSLYDYQDGTRTDSTDFLGIVGVKISDNYSLKTIFSYSQDLHIPEASDWGDTAISLSHKPWTLNKTFNMASSMTLLAPTSKDSHTRQNMLYGVGAGFTFGINDSALINGLHLLSAVSISRLVHQYETAIDGRVNTQYSSRQTLSGVYEFGQFSVSLEFVHRNGITYQGNLKESFEHTEELGYAITNHIGAAIGHTLAGSIFKANGEDSNVTLLNDNESKVYGSMSVTF